MMRLLVFAPIFLLLSTLQATAQLKTFIKDTSKCSYEKFSGDSLIDSIVVMNIDNCDVPWEVYYDKELRHIASKQLLSMNQDTLTKLDYWRNDQLKRKLVSVKNKYGNMYKGHYLYTSYYEETFCQNGQLIVAWFPESLKRQHLISYFCNGQKRSEYDRLGFMADGFLHLWYENGNKKSISFYKHTENTDYSTMEGNWEYYNETGGLDSTQVYKNDKLLRTISSLPKK